MCAPSPNLRGFGASRCRFYRLSVSTTEVLSSAVAGTMYANRSGLQRGTIQRILLAWLLTVPASMTLSGTLVVVGNFLIPGSSN